MNILIIGSKGFIGQHCLYHFRTKPDLLVFGCDVVIDYIDKQYFLVDISTNSFSKIFQSKQFDVCINCSGAASVPDSLINPQRDYLLNATNVFKILDAIRNYNSDCKFINLSSAAVYGNPQSLPINESHPINPVSPYGYHKWHSELICQEMHDIFNLRTCSLRIFSAFGEGLHKQLFWDLFHKLQNQQSIKLFGTGQESRDFIHIADIIQTVELVIKKANFKNDIINVANGQEVFIENAVATFFYLFGTKKTYTFNGNKRIGDPINWVADITELKKLGYQQKTSFQQGITKYIKWLKELK